jgi:hypothetical protein
MQILIYKNKQFMTPLAWSIDDDDAVAADGTLYVVLTEFAPS